MSSEKIEFGLGNPLRVVVTSWTGDNSANRKNDKSFKLFKEYSSPFADAFFQQFISSDPCIVQIQSSFDSTNTCKVKNYFTDADVKTITLTEEVDESAYKVYEADVALDTGLSNGKYYLLFNGTDSDGGTYEARSEPFELVSEADCNSLLITYYNNEPGFGIDYRTGVTNYIRIPGIFDQDSDTAEVDISTDSKGIRRNISDEIQQARFLQLGNKNNPNGIPDWYAQKLNYALAHDYCDIEGIEVSSENRIPQEYGRGLYWNDGEAIIHLSDGLTRNLHDADERVLYLDAPTGLTASPQSESQILLEWVDESENEDSFEVWRSLTTGTGFVKIAEVFGADEYTDSGLDADTTYYYKVRAKAEGSLSGFSSEASAKTFNAFISTWKTDNTGSSNNDQITLPLVSTGTYAMIVAWGDGQRDLINAYDQAEVTHTYASSGTYEVKIYGTMTGWKFNNGGDCKKIVEITKWGDFNAGNQDSVFYGCSNMDVGATDIIDLTGQTTFASWFRGCSSLIYNSSIDNWETGSITAMNSMFQLCTLFNQPLNSWDVSSVTHFGSMLRNCDNFNQPLNNWDVSSGTNFSSFLRASGSFNSSLSGWVFGLDSNHEDMLNSCISFNQDISDWTFTGTQRSERMFDNANSFNQNLNTGNFAATWAGVSCVHMFRNCSAYNQPMSNFDFTSATDCTGFMENCVLFNQDVNGWDFTVSVSRLTEMFKGCTNFNNGGVALNWSFRDNTNLTSTFENCTSFIADVSGMDVSNVNRLNSTFRNTPNNSDFSLWSPSSAFLEQMNSTFRGNTAFNRDISGWDVSGVTTATFTFAGATSFNQDLSSWNLSACTTIQSMFEGATAFNNGGSSLTWTTSSSLITLHGVFKDATAFNQTVSFNYTNVNTMVDMFNNASSFNQPVNYSGSQVQNITSMFANSSFDQDISGWDVTSVVLANGFLTGVTLSTANYNALLVGWESQAVQNNVVFHGGNSTHSGSGSTARAALIADHSWTITDGGAA
jgi:hypothetical protein